MNDSYIVTNLAELTSEVRVAKYCTIFISAEEIWFDFP
jgi:hypothetical protein